MEFGIKNTIPFKLALLQNKYLDVSLIKYVQDLYKENYKTLMKEIKELNSKIFHIHRLGRLNSIKMSGLSNLIYGFNVFSIKIPANYYVKINKLILKFMWIGKRLRIANTILTD